MDFIKTIEERQKKENTLLYKVGDTVVVHFEIIEGKVKRIQKYEGIVISIKGSGVRKTFTVRKNSYGVGVERVFPVNSPRVIKVELVKTGKVRQSKLYYLRDKIGKDARIKEMLGPKANARIAASRAANKAADVAEEAINAEAKAANATSEPAK
ncbi:50S ribosomal protein L19 [Treponema pectinovorum]|uniref:50S ribosomal protein L19 n=1 Tax=Treponema pectinovorum TaxID=164 RepID=UPI0011F14694|nr:50S ribosomal protein L19 [Treponema pectinovorum]